MLRFLTRLVSFLSEPLLAIGSFLLLSTQSFSFFIDHVAVSLPS